MNDLQHTDIPADSSDEAEGAEILDETAMVDAMRRYRSARGELDIQKRRAREYVEQVKAETEAELAPLEAHLQRLRISMQTFIEEYNAGLKFSCPGLGTAYASDGLSVRIADEEALRRYVEKELPDGLLDIVFPRKLSAAAARKAATEALRDTGEQLPGVEAERTRNLNVRLSSPDAPEARSG